MIVEGIELCVTLTDPDIRLGGTWIR